MMSLKSKFNFRFGFSVGITVMMLVPKNMFYKLAEYYYTVTEKDDIL